MTRPVVFLSHQSGDKPKILEVAKYLEACGVDVILDEWVFAKGKSLPGEISAGIERSSAFVLFWSQRASQSSYVQYEDELALTRELKDPSYNVQVVRLDETEVSKKHAFRIYHDWRKDDASRKNLDVLRRSITDQPTRTPEESKRVSLAGTVVLFVLTDVFLAFVIAFEETVATHLELDSSGTWWDQLMRQHILEMPSAFAIGVSIPLAVLLMVVTHLIAKQYPSPGMEATLGHKASWLVSTIIILVIASMGIYYGFQPRFGPGRFGLLGLGLLVYALFSLDGFPEGERVGLWRRPWKKGKNV